MQKDWKWLVSEWSKWRDALAQIKNDLQEAVQFDKRGMLLGPLVLLTSAFSLAVVLNVIKGASILSAFATIAAFLIALLVTFFLAALLKNRYNERATNTFHFAFVGALAGAGVFADTGAFAGAFAGVATGVIAVVGAGEFASVFAFAFAFAFAVVGAGEFAFAVAFAVAGAFAFAVAYPGVVNSERGRKLFLRSQKFSRHQNDRIAIHTDWSQPRKRSATLIEALLQSRNKLTIGLAGRRGLGKTSLLHAFDPHRKKEPPRLQEENDLKYSKKVQAARLRDLSLFVPTPTEFAEQPFLMALLERLAQQVSKLLSGLLPAVKSFEVEQELLEKRRILRWNHGIFVVLLLALASLNFYHLERNNPTPVLDNLFFEQDSTQTPNRPKSLLFTQMQDSLFGELQQLAAPLQDSLARIDSLLNPKLDSDAWNLKGEYNLFFGGEFAIDATWDSLKKSTDWPQLDSLFARYEDYQTVLDSIDRVDSLYHAQADSLIAKSELAASEIAGFGGLDWFYAFNFVLLVLVFPAYYFSREGEQRFSKRVYGVVRNEVALYERSTDLLERLHYQMSFGESQSQTVSVSRWGLSFGRRRSKNVQRAVRPYTTISLIDEYRKYIEDVKMYLNDALKESGIDEPVKIHIAIDELDKILDSDKLHNMLKSMKAIFEIEDVYYFLSISEDALETYRLRHVDTKNEIDSAFTHIIPVPPMDAPGSLVFFIEHHSDWPPELLPAAIVFGGGVPRDMHRLSQMLGANQHNSSLHDCLNKLADEDIAACRDMLLLNNQLSDEGKQDWLAILEKSRFASKETATALLDELAKMSITDFAERNLCDQETAHIQLRRLRTLLRGMVVKGYIYTQVAEHALLPEVLRDWPEVDNIEQILAEPDGDPWLANLEPLRDGIFELSRNPLMVWENLRNL